MKNLNLSSNENVPKGQNREHNGYKSKQTESAEILISRFEEKIKQAKLNISKMYECIDASRIKNRLNRPNKKSKPLY